MMYPNGEVPLSKLIHVSGNIWLPPGTLARVNWAIEQAHAKYGVRLRITGQNSSHWNTWNGYRPLSAQILYRNAYGVMAAVPRTSSHGGTYRGQEVFAADFDNWAELGWARFSAIMRLAGLTVDFVTPTERWHVGDFNNVWFVPSFASGGGGSALNPGSTTTIKLPEEDDMRFITVKDNIDGNGVGGWALLNTSWKPGGPNPRPYLIIRVDEKDAQARADRWMDVWGAPRSVSRQAWLDSIDAVVKTA